MEPKGKKKPHRYAVTVSTGGVAEPNRCSGCWKPEPPRGTEGPGSSPPDDDGPLAPPKPTSTSHLPSHPLAAPPTDG